jgi:hypothetical protein
VIRVHRRAEWLSRYKASPPDPRRRVHKGRVNMLGVAEGSTHRRLPFFHGHKRKARSLDFIVDPALNIATSLLSGRVTCLSSKLVGDSIIKLRSRR